MRRVHKEEIWDPSVPGAVRRSPGAAPHPHPRAGRLHGRRAARRSTRRRCAPASAACASSASTSLAVMFLFSLRQPRARAAGPRAHPRGVPRRRAHLAVARGHAARPRVRAHLDHAGQRLRRPADRALRRAASASSLRAAGYAGELLIMQSTGGVMPPGYVARRPCHCSARARPAASWARHAAADRAGIADFVAVDMGGTSFDICLVRGGRPEIKHRLELALPLLHRHADGRRAVRRRRRRLDRPGAPGRAARRARVGRARSPGPSATAAAATEPR